MRVAVVVRYCRLLSLQDEFGTFASNDLHLMAAGLHLYSVTETCPYAEMDNLQHKAS